VQWLVTDQLGTPRMVFDKTGSLSGVSRHDYLPFGEELYVGTGGRTSTEGYNTDNVRQHFTGKERDNETGLDYFGARYYASTQGRFTSIDPDNYQAKRDLKDAQSWNAYSYVNNNPLSRTDPDGRGFWERIRNLFNGYGFKTDKQVQEMEDKWRNWLREQEKQAGGTLVYCPGGCGPGSKGYKVNIDALSRNEVLRYSASLKESLENHTVQHFSSDEIEKMTQIISLTVAPQHVQEALSTIKRTGNPPDGYRGGDPFENDGRDGGQVLPKTDTGGNAITYREYDVQPYQQGVNRGGERIVRGSDGSTWYTADHYKTFARVD
jgi:RHS repeat-associated protein